MKYFSYLILLVFVSCTNSTTEKPTAIVEKKIINKFSDYNIQQIYNLLDQRKSDAIAVYFKNSNSLNRAEAANAFATLQDSTHLQQLHILLYDSVPLVQQKAAWAIGQIKSESSVESLINALPSVSEKAQTEVLEAIGKCANESSLSFFENFEPNESNFLGYSKSLYQYAYNNSFPSSLLEKTISLIEPSIDIPSKIYLAGALSRAKSADLAIVEQKITHLIANEKEVEILLSLYRAIGKIKSKTTSTFLEEKIKEFDQNIPDYRIIVAALTAYSKQKKTDWKIFRPFLTHANENIGLAASICLNNSTYYPVNKTILEELSGNYSARIEAKVLGYALKKTKNKKWIETLKFNFRNATSYTDKSYYLKALSVNKYQAKWIEDKMINEGHPIIKSAAAESLISMKENGLIPTNMNFVSTIRAGFNTNDVGVLALFAMHIRNNGDEYAKLIQKPKFIGEALDQLTLPRDIETYNEMVKAINVFVQDSLEVKQVVYNTPLDWEMIQEIPTNQQAVVLTTQGKMTIHLDVENAPGSTSNFIRLAKDGFFDNKIFHRVVPNFVVQTGCTRGDGYGSTNHTIRSEFSLHNYSTGAVGMASAGKDTESGQWFVTHAPTPFLEGRYSIFGYVDDADLLTLHQLKMGDKILSVTIK